MSAKRPNVPSPRGPGRNHQDSCRPGQEQANPGLRAPSSEPPSPPQAGGDVPTFGPDHRLAHVILTLVQGAIEVSWIAYIPKSRRYVLYTNAAGQGFKQFKRTKYGMTMLLRGLSYQHGGHLVTLTAAHAEDRDPLRWFHSAQRVCEDLATIQKMFRIGGESATTIPALSPVPESATQLAPATSKRHSGEEPWELLTADNTVPAPDAARRWVQWLDADITSQFKNGSSIWNFYERECLKNVKFMFQLLPYAVPPQARPWVGTLEIDQKPTAHVWVVVESDNGRSMIDLTVLKPECCERAVEQARRAVEQARGRIDPSRDRELLRIELESILHHIRLREPFAETRVVGAVPPSWTYRGRPCELHQLSEELHRIAHTLEASI